MFMPRPTELAADEGRLLNRMQLGAAQGEELMPPQFFAF